MKDEDETRAAAVARLREKHEAYVAVFGTADKPTTGGAIVLADLERHAGFYGSPRYCPRQGDRAGPVDPYGTLYNVGLQDMVKHIHRRIGWSQEQTEPED